MSCNLYASGDAMVLVIIYAEPMFAAALSFVHLPPRKDWVIKIHDKAFYF